MKKIIKGKGQGKTTELIEISAQTGNYIVCRNLNTVSLIERMAHEKGLKIPQPLTYDEFLGRDYYGAGVGGVLIDDVDALVSYISTVPVNAITITVG